MFDLLTRIARRTLKTVQGSALALVLAASGLGLAQPGSAQGLFAPVVTVNEQAITGYELEQRRMMLEVLNAPGDTRALAREQLIDDRLRLQAAAQMGITPTPDEVLEGMEEFAGRANLSRQEFTQALAQRGVAEETFRDFVRAGVAWRQVVQARFVGQANISEAEIDRAARRGGSGSNVRVLLSEIIMPAPPGQEAQVRARAQQISQYTTEGQFSAAARQYSATASRGNGGRLPWQNLSDLPPVLRPIVLGLAPGEVSDPLPIPNAVALFQLRGIEETGYSAPEVASVDYATYLIPGGRSAEALARARVVASRVDRCDDLYGVAKGQDPSVLDRQTLPVAQIPTDIAIELSKLDPGETSAALTRGNALMLVMLCGRTNAASDEASREDLALGLRNRRVESLAEGYLSQLRADAYIRDR